MPSPEDAAQWYINMGCEVLAGRKDAARCGTVQLLFYRRAATAGTEGTGMHHIGFSFLNLAEKMKELEAGGVKIVTPMRDGGRLKSGFVGPRGARGSKWSKTLSRLAFITCIFTRRTQSKR